MPYRIRDLRSALPYQASRCPQCGVDRHDERFINSSLLEVTTMEDAADRTRRYLCQNCNYEWVHTHTDAMRDA